MFCLLATLGIQTPLRATTLPAGFTESVVATGIYRPTTMEFAPDGRLFVNQQNGFVRVIKNGTLLTTPFVSVPIDGHGERGLIGITFDPDFTTNNYVYLYYTATTPTIHNRVSRFTANGDVAVPGSERILLELEDLGEATIHNGGAIHFGSDKKLYVGVGDNTNSANSQSLNTRLGKMLRINRDGSIPTTNPYYETATGANRAIWAMGLRNPFSFSVQPGTGRILINDVGQDIWEEINEGIAGSNYGWPATEGPTTNSAYRSPIFAYEHDLDDPVLSSACSITGGTFYNPSTAQFPASYVGSYFFADYCGSWINVLASDGSVTRFAGETARPVDVKVSSNGSLYYLSRDNEAVYKLSSSQAPAISRQPTSQTVQEGQSATFRVTASGAAPLTYQWQRNETNIAGATTASYTLASATLADNGAKFRVVVSNAYGRLTSNQATLTITTNSPPQATITSPIPGSLYSGGQTISVAGTATDPEDGTLGAGAFSWTVVFYHGTHTHPFLGPLTGIKSGSFTIPTQGETATDVWYRIQLTVTDSKGAQAKSSVDIFPRLVALNLATTPSGLQLTLDGQPVTTPITIESVVGLERTLGAISAQTLEGEQYQFDAWTDGKAISHIISTPTADTTYTAAFRNTANSTVTKINFQPSSAPLPTGYRVDSGQAYSSSRGFGWVRQDSLGAATATPLSVASNSRDRNRSGIDQRLDTIMHMQYPPGTSSTTAETTPAAWEYALPDGTYIVTVSVGDMPGSGNTYDSQHSINIEGVQGLNRFQASPNREYKQVTLQVEVTDGRLTIDATGGTNTKINFVDIQR
ncbi:MAG: PQQ-dependent sugar dehydrogenase [Gemmatimonadaceae bacterium]|nr:PQQ-dependent sugar dehydrogenase [Gloeobacterales cyanobacterium ES-bin-141]